VLTIPGAEGKSAPRRANHQHGCAHVEHGHSRSRPHSIRRHANGKHDHAQAKHDYSRNKPCFLQGMLNANTIMLMMSTAIPKCL